MFKSHRYQQTFQQLLLHHRKVTTGINVIVFFLLLVRQIRTLSPTLCICPSGFGPRVWCVRWRPGSQLWSQFLAGLQACQCLLRRIVCEALLGTCVVCLLSTTAYSTECVCCLTLLMWLKCVKDLPHWSHGSFLTNQPYIRARVTFYVLK